MQGAGMSPDGQQFLPGYSRLSYRAIEVVVNDPKFDANIFQTKIPIGYLVTDVRTSTRRDYLLLDDGIEKDLHRGDTLPQPHPATRPDAVVGP
jgi:hypothetical protein